MKNLPIKFCFVDARCQELANSKYWIYAVNASGQVVATVSLQYYNATGYVDRVCAWISDLFVLPEHRHQGLGRDMILEALRHMEAACPEATRAMAGILNTNRHSINAFERCGFQRLGGFHPPDSPSLYCLAYGTDLR